MIRFTFRQCSIITSEDNLMEAYVNRHIEGESFRVIVKDNSKVTFTQYSLSAKMFTIEFEHSTIYEGENKDFPIISFNRTAVL